MAQAAPASGLVTAFYLSTGEPAPGAPRTQTELDFEFLGKDPRGVQTNYFMHGVGDHEQWHKLPFNTSAEEHKYTIDVSHDVVKWLVVARSRLREFSLRCMRTSRYGTHRSMRSGPAAWTGPRAPSGQNSDVSRVLKCMGEVFWRVNIAMSKLPSKADVDRWWSEAGCTQPLSKKGYNYYKRKSKDAIQRKAAWLLAHDSPKCVAHFADAPTMPQMSSQAPTKMSKGMDMIAMHRWARTFDEECALECYGYCPRPGQCVAQFEYA